jgi:hypothetical protein
MGLSPQHASTVQLVLNPDSGAITPQFHVVFDDWFATVSSVADTLPDFHSPEWAELFGDSVYQYPFDDDNLADAIDLSAPPAPANADRVARAMDQLEPPQPFSSAPPPVDPLPQLSVAADPAPTASTAPMSAPREPVISAPREPVLPQLVPRVQLEPVISTPREPVLSTPREPTMSTPREVEGAVQQREIQATTVPTPPPKRKPAPKKTPPPPQLRRSGRATRSPDRLIESAGYYTRMKPRRLQHSWRTLAVAKLSLLLRATLLFSSRIQPSLQSSR